MGYSIFASGAYEAIDPDVAFSQEKPHFANLTSTERKWECSTDAPV